MHLEPSSQLFNVSTHADNEAARRSIDGSGSRFQVFGVSGHVR